MSCCVGGKHRSLDVDDSDQTLETASSHSQGCTDDGGVDPLEKSFGRSSVHAAAQRGQVRLLRELKNKGLSLEIADNDGVTPMHVAAECNRWNVIEVLSSLGAPPDPRDVCHQTPAHYGAWHGHKDVIRVLHKLGVPLDDRDEDNKTPAHYAARQGNCSVLRMLFQINPNYFKIKDNDGRPPLFYATGDATTMFRIMRPDTDSVCSPNNVCFVENGMPRDLRPNFQRSCSDVRSCNSRANDEYGAAVPPSPRSMKNLNMSPRIGSPKGRHSNKMLTPGYDFRQKDASERYDSRSRRTAESDFRRSPRQDRTMGARTGTFPISPRTKHQSCSDLEERTGRDEARVNIDDKHRQDTSRKEFFDESPRQNDMRTTATPRNSRKNEVFRRRTRTTDRF